MMYRKLIIFTSFWSIVMGLLVLIGWEMNTDLLRQHHPNLFGVNPLTAICFILSGFWVSIEVAKSRDVVLKSLKISLSLLVLILAAGNLFFPWDLVLFTGRLDHTRMAFATTVGFVFIGSAMLFASISRRFAGKILQWLLFGVLVLTMLSFVGFLVNDRTILQSKPFGAMSLLSGITLCLLALGIFCLYPENVAYRIFFDQHTWSEASRKITPAIILVPILVFVAERGLESEKYITGDFGISVEIAAISITLLLFVWRMTQVLNKKELLQERTMKELTEKSLRLEETNKEMEQFVFMASHDLQEPLRKISVYTDMLDRNRLVSTEYDKFIGKMRTDTGRMRGLISGLLKYAVLDKEDEVFALVNLHLLVEETVQDFDLLLKEKSGEVIQIDLPVISGIKIQLEQLFHNLIGNALKYSTAEPRIEIRCSVASPEELRAYTKFEGEQSYFRFDVRDNGIGFDQKYAENVFTIFTRLHAKGSSGSGIGLAICKKIVVRHGGCIRVESQPGVGSNFIFYLPVSVSPNNS